MKKKETLGKYEKGIIIGGIAVLIIFLILLTADGIKNIGKNNNNLALSEQEEKITNAPNAPMISAGIIPVKYDGDNLVIAKNDTNWYNLNEGKPAYMMLNDGVYQSELVVDMTNKKLANENIGQVVEKEEQGTIYMWIPRFAQKQNGEIGYIKEEIQPGGEWIVPDTFSYIIEDETKPNFSLSGIWIEKEPLGSAGEVNTKVTNMNKENNQYGLIANTIVTNAGEGDSFKDTCLPYLRKVAPVGASIARPEGSVGEDDSVYPITNPTNPNRTILKVVNTNKVEPVKANITQNTVANTIEIRVTYTKNGIREILDENGNKLTLQEENGVILADTGEKILGKGTYTFTVVDNKGNRQNLIITPNINSIYKVAYINGTDNMDNTTTYTKTTQTPTSTETALINQLSTVDTSKTYSRAITDSNKAITAITQAERTAEDEQMYLWKRYGVITKERYFWEEYQATSNQFHKSDTIYYFKNVNKNGNSATYKTLTGLTTVKGSDFYYSQNQYTTDLDVTKYQSKYSGENLTVYYEWDDREIIDSFYGKYVRTGTEHRRITETYEDKGDFYDVSISYEDSFSDKAINGSFWYEKWNIAPKYTLHKYDQSLTLQSTYDVDTKILTTVPIDISNRGHNKIKLTLSASGSDYKTYISSDNANWQEVTDITSGVAKELNVDGFNNLYIKIETNTSAINNIDVAYYKY